MERIPTFLMQHVNAACAIIAATGMTEEQVKARWPSLYEMILRAGRQGADDERVRQHELAETN